MAARIADRLRARRKAALVVAGQHAYGRQLDEQLAAARLPRTDDRAQAEVVVLAGLEGEAEIGRAAALSPLRRPRRAGRVARASGPRLETRAV